MRNYGLIHYSAIALSIATTAPHSNQGALAENLESQACTTVLAELESESRQMAIELAQGAIHYEIDPVRELLRTRLMARLPDELGECYRLGQRRPSESAGQYEFIRWILDGSSPEAYDWNQVRESETLMYTADLGAVFVHDPPSNAAVLESVVDRSPELKTALVCGSDAGRELLGRDERELLLRSLLIEDEYWEAIPCAARFLVNYILIFSETRITDYSLEEAQNVFWNLMPNTPDQSLRNINAMMAPHVLVRLCLLNPGGLNLGDYEANDWPVQVFGDADQYYLCRVNYEFGLMNIGRHSESVPDLEAAVNFNPRAATLLAEALQTTESSISMREFQASADYLGRAMDGAVVLQTLFEVSND